jgi:hypothetical protein
MYLTEATPQSQLSSRHASYSLELSIFAPSIGFQAVVFRGRVVLLETSLSRE